MSKDSTDELTIDGFKEGLTKRLNHFHEILQKRQIITRNTEFMKLIDQPVQAASKLLNGGRHLTNMQLVLLASKTGLNINWYFTGRGEMFEKGEIHSKKPELSARVAKAISLNEIDPDLGIDIIDELSYKNKVIDRMRSEAQDLSKKLIQVMEVVSRYNKSGDWI